MMKRMFFALAVICALIMCARCAAAESDPGTEPQPGSVILFGQYE